MNRKTNRRKERTPVDDVRRVREKLDKECGGDVRKLAALANKTAEEYRKKLGLKMVQSLEVSHVSPQSNPSRPNAS